jgi:hypothetical protein
LELILEYHKGVRPSITASIVFATVVVLSLLFVSTTHAQVNGPPASVTSPGFGGHPINGTPSSVTSLGPHGYPSDPHFSSTDGHRHSGAERDRNKDGSAVRHRRDDSGGALLYAVPVPYAVDDNGAVDNPDAETSDPNEQGGPTVFDRRGSGEHSYVPPGKDVAPAHSAKVADDDPPAEPEPTQDPTLLVFKDGRTVEIQNYAIQGATLFDLTPGHHRKIALMDLDLEATRKQNDERGVMFQLPSSYKVN